jgi:small-conductance mechanosensitive channel
MSLWLRNLSRWTPLGVAVLLAAIPLSALGQRAEPDDEPTAGRPGSGIDAYPISTLDFGLPDLDTPASLETPQGTLELFVGRAQAEDWVGAAHALNLSFASVESRNDAARLARQLDAVIRSEVTIDWTSIPDTPDGRLATAEGPSHTRRTLNLGQASLDGRTVPVNLQRFMAPDDTAVWLFSPFLVAHLPDLSERYGSGWLEQHLPRSWQRVKVGETAVWEWIAILILAFLGLTIGRLARTAIRLLSHKARGYLHVALAGSVVPAGFAIGLLFIYAAVTHLLSLTGPATRWLDTVLSSALVLVVAWLVIRVIGRLADTARLRYEAHLSDDYTRGRQLKTQLSVAHKVFVTLSAIVVLGVALSTFSVFSSLSISLLASAGVLTVLIGVAAQPILGNLMAGIQIATTEPVRIGDMIAWGDAFGWVEDITFTFVVMRNWDDRRIIIPHSEILSKSFENWSKKDESMTREVWLYTDPSADVDAVRAHFEKLVEADDRWDGRVNQLDVRDMSERALHLRGLVSAAHPRTVWSLHMDLREQMIRFLQQQEMQPAFVHARVQLHDEPTRSGERLRNVAPSGGDSEERLDDAPESNGDS